ncbi:MAG: DUF4058 family protein [Planctomycetia bacterium]|nr:DUF4058 family protein [Planctomycetia bacterium]
MPSPFPGMDPYLEDPGLWPDFHHRVISIASDLITERTRPKYYVCIDERVYISDEDERDRPARIPDFRISARPEWEGEPYWPRRSVGVEIAEPVEAITLSEEETHEARLEVIDCESRSVVTVIEVLSPSNKDPGSHGHASFEQKRQEVMLSPSHWVEIDLLRRGTGAWTRDPLPPHEYLVHVSRAGQRPRGLLWPIRLSQRLPGIPIPLRPEDPDVSLDLQAVMTTAYDRAGYDLRFDYARDPVPPLSSKWSGWADDLLKSRGLRTA